MSKEPTATWLTQEAADRLAGELAELEGPRRSEVVKKIEAARAEGDLKENGGYHAAKEEQGKIEARIRQLRHMLEHAIIGTPPSSESGVVGVGMKIKVDIGGDQMNFLLGSREIAATDLDVYSEKSPLGSAIMGAKVGDTVSYLAPNGREIKVAILEAEPF
jgi:transcription elongation factor GreA